MERVTGKRLQANVMSVDAPTRQTPAGFGSQSSTNRELFDQLSYVV